MSKKLLDNPDLIDAMTERNYELAKQYFSYTVLRKKAALHPEHHPRLLSRRVLPIIAHDAHGRGAPIRHYIPFSTLNNLL